MLCCVEKYGAPAAGLLVLNKKKSKIFSILQIIAHIRKQNKTNCLSVYTRLRIMDCRYITTLGQFCKLSCHWRKNDGSNPSSHWPIREAFT